MFDHWGSTIYWDQMSWEAFVALVAVGAAGLVGWRQVGVLQRQAEIEALGVKIALREERMKAYDATRFFIGHILLSGSVPGRQTLANANSGGPVTLPEVAINFYDAIDRSRFLFRPETREQLQRIYSLAMELGDIRAAPETFYEDEGGKLRSRAQDVRRELADIHSDVAGLFGDELNLTAGARPRSIWKFLARK